MKTNCLLIVMLCLCIDVISQRNGISKILDKTDGKFRVIEPLIIDQAARATKPVPDSYLQKYSVLKPVTGFTGLQKRLKNSDNIFLKIPDGLNEVTTVKLRKNQLTAPGFVVTTSEGKRYNNFSGPELHFIGIKNGNESSVSAFSFSETGVKGFISDQQGNTVIEQINDKHGPHILYRDHDIFQKRVFKCETTESDEYLFQIKKEQTDSTVNNTCKTVKIYIECTYEMYKSHNKNINDVVDFVFTMFNASSSLFRNDGIIIQISEIFIWSKPDIYIGQNTIGLLDLFEGRLRQEFLNGRPLNGDVAHIITSPNLSGGVSNGIGFQNFCGVNGNYRCAASSNIKNFPALPAFSYGIYTFVHETGHMLGSPHTHSCTWSGGPIDNCTSPEGGCSPGPAPVNGGTIMSYCYLQPFGVNFSNGFGPLPADRIRTSIENNSCISLCADTICGNMKVREITSLVTENVLRLKWLKEAPKYKISLKELNSSLWTHFEVEADSLVINKNACQEQYTFSIAPYCPELNKYRTAVTSIAGDSNAIRLKFYTYSPGETDNPLYSACAGSEVILKVWPDSLDEYSWYHNNVLQPLLTNHNESVLLPGKYVVKLNRNGCNYVSDTATVISTPQNPRISAVIAFNNRSVNFSPASNCSKSYLWDFGDGMQDTAQAPAHTYQSDGRYNVVLKVWDADSNMDITNRNINLAEEIVDSLNGRSSDGSSSLLKFSDFECSKSALFTLDSFTRNGQGPLGPLLYYTRNVGGNASTITSPQTGTIEFRIFPSRGLIKRMNGINTIYAAEISDTGFIVNSNPVVATERRKFFVHYSKWGGIQVAVDSVILGDISHGTSGPLKIDQWNNIGISYGNGIQVIINGELYAESGHIIDSAHAALLGTFNFGSHLGRRNYMTPGTINNPLYYKSFEGAIDIVRFSSKEKDYSFSSKLPWQGTDTVIINKSICSGESFEGYSVTTTYYKNSVTTEGCDSVTMVRLTVQSDIDAIASIVHPVDSIKGSVTINATGGVSPYNYLWNSGAVTSAVNLGAGEYKLLITDASGCKKQFSYRLYLLSNKKDFIAVLPNPVSRFNQLTLRIGTTSDKTFNTVIYDMLGRRVWFTELQTNAGVSDFVLKPNLPAGEYILTLESQGERRSVKFLVK